MANKYKEYLIGVALPETVQLRDEGEKASMSVKLRVTEGPKAGVEKTFFGSLNGGAVEYTLEALRTMGWRCSDITALEGLGSTKVTIALKDDEWNGKVRERVSVFPIRANTTVTEENKAAFAAKFKAIAAGIKPVEISDLNKAPEVLPEAAQEPAKELAAPADKDMWG